MTWTWARLEARRRWRSLLILTLLVAVGSGTVLTAVAGAQRGSSAMDRLLEETLPATALVTPFTPGFDWAPVRALPEVEALAEVVFTGFEIDGRPAADTFMIPPADDQAMRTVERPVVLSGRLADPARADEVVVTPAFTRTFGKSVGDTVTIGLFTPEQVDTGQGPDTARTNLMDVWILTNQQQAAGVAAGIDVNATAPAQGPVIEAEIVGVVRSPVFGDRLDTPGFVIPSAGLHAQYEPNLVGADGLGSVNALVRLSGGASAIPSFVGSLTDATGRSDIDVIDLAAAAGAMADGARFESGVLYVLSIVVAGAAMLFVGLAVARYAAASVGDVRVLRAVGMTPGQQRWSVAALPAAAALAGTTLGSMLAIGASAWFPIGSASQFEPAPGVDADPLVTAVAIVGVPVLVAVVATVATAASMRAMAGRSGVHSSVVTAAAAQAGLSVPVVTGARFALEVGGGRQRSPVRPALFGAVAGVTGVLAALTFSSAVQDAATNPARIGVVHQVEAWVGFDNVDIAPADAVFPALAEVPGVAGLNDVRTQVAVVPSGSQVTVASLSPIGTSSTVNWVMAEGRMPLAPAEAWLSRLAVDAFGVVVGDTMKLIGPRGELEVAVVGVGIADPTMGPVAMVDPSAYDHLFGEGFLGHYAEITLEPGVDPDAIISDLRAAVPDVAFGLFPYVPEGLPELRFMRPLPVLLAGVVSVLALVLVGHALAAGTRRHRADLAVLRALGMTPAQSRSAIATHAAVLALAGLLAGVPLGIALGRVAWRYLADTLYLHYVPPTAWLALATVVPAAMLVALLLAAWPGHQVASMRLAPVLRTE